MRADAIVVLGGRPNRVPVGRRLLEEGVAPELLVFNATGEGDGDTIYVRPDPYTTRGEARAVARIGRERGWRSVVVVTSSYHVRRARLIFRRAWEGELEMVAAPPAPWRLPYDLLSEAVKLAVAVTVRRAA